MLRVLVVLAYVPQAQERTLRLRMTVDKDLPGANFRRIDGGRRDLIGWQVIPRQRVMEGKGWCALVEIRKVEAKTKASGRQVRIEEADLPGSKPPVREDIRAFGVRNQYRHIRKQNRADRIQECLDMGELRSYDLAPLLVQRIIAR